VSKPVLTATGGSAYQGGGACRDRMHSREPAMDLNLSDIQGNIVPGLNKDHEAFLFVRFRSGEA